MIYTIKLRNKTIHNATSKKKMFVSKQYIVSKIQYIVFLWLTITWYNKFHQIQNLPFRGLVQGLIVVMTMVTNVAFILWHFGLPRLVAINVYTICHISQWISSLLAIGSMNNLTPRHCSCWCSMYKTMWLYTFLYTLWKRIGSFNEYYLVIYWMLLLLLVVVNNNVILLMALLNGINGKTRIVVYGDFAVFALGNR